MGFNTLAIEKSSEVWGALHSCAEEFERFRELVLAQVTGHLKASSDDIDELAGVRMRQMGASESKY